MVASKRLVSLFLPVALSLVLAACSGGNSNGDDDDGPGTPDAGGSSSCEQNCAAPNECCQLTGGTFCIATTSDKMNCGGCGMACDPALADSCGGGQCKCGFGPACNAGSACCDDGCKDLQNDAQNCGMCGLSCGAGATCTNGMCTCGGVQCGAGESCCNGTCVNTMTDPANCGMCGMACTGDMNACNGGTCGCPGGGAACPAPGQGVVPACCATGCANICADTANCGGCGMACGAGDVCFFGGCLNGGGSPLAECLGFP
jgi:hypothetical protein